MDTKTKYERMLKGERDWKFRQEYYQKCVEDGDRYIVCDEKDDYYMLDDTVVSDKFPVDIDFAERHPDYEFCKAIKKYLEHKLEYEKMNDK